MIASVESRADAERHNSVQRINRLPIELLSRIFIAGDNLNYASPLPKVQFVNDDLFNVNAFLFQEIAIQVCHHWRLVGIAIPKLWSNISSNRYLPDYRTELFLARSGTITPLHLSLDMMGEFMEGLSDRDAGTYAERALRYLTFIVEKGGVTSRWKTLRVLCEQPIVMLEIVDFISTASLDNLVTLELENDPEDVAQMESEISDALARRNGTKKVMFHFPPPKLRDLQLRGMPTCFFFENPSEPLVSNLTQLELGVTYTLPTLDGLCELLSRNPGLESLLLDMSLVDQIHLYAKRGWEVQVNLPHLRRFALKEPKSANWAISVLTMIDAPQVEEFTLDLNHSMPPHSPGAVAMFTMIGRKNGQLLKNWPTDPNSLKGTGPIFPALRHLALGPFPDRGVVLENMIRSFPALTRLDWELEESCEQAILSLTVPPLPCPQLEHLRVHGVPNDELLQVVKERASYGLPLKVVEVNSRDWNMITEETKLYMEGALESFIQYVDENGSDSSSDEDWTDTEDEGDGNDEDGPRREDEGDEDDYSSSSFESFITD